MTKPVGKLRIADRTGKYKFRATRAVSRFSRRSCRTEEARGQATGFEPIQHMLPSQLRSLPLELFACFGPKHRSKFVSWRSARSHIDRGRFRRCRDEPVRVRADPWRHNVGLRSERERQHGPQCNRSLKLRSLPSTLGAHRRGDEKRRITPRGSRAACRSRSLLG